MTGLMIRPLLLAALVVVPLAAPSHVWAAEPLRTLSVQGTGAAAGRPDMANASASLGKSMQACYMDGWIISFKMDCMSS